MGGGVKRGALTGFSGIVERLQSKDRLQVLFDLFGRKTTVLLREAEVTAG
jgi:transcription antitermination factor NusG